MMHASCISIRFYHHVTPNQSRAIHAVLYSPQLTNQTHNLRWLEHHVSLLDFFPAAGTALTFFFLRVTALTIFNTLQQHILADLLRNQRPEQE